MQELSCVRVYQVAVVGPREETPTVVLGACCGGLCRTSITSPPSRYFLHGITAQHSILSCTIQFIREVLIFVSMSGSKDNTDDHALLARLNALKKSTIDLNAKK